jgi:hypothetical protein
MNATDAVVPAVLGNPDAVFGHLSGKNNGNLRIRFKKKI